MAGQAEKKRARVADVFAQYYLIAIIVVSLIFGLCRVFWHREAPSRFHIAATVGCYVIYYFCYNGIVDALAMGVPYTHQNDIFIVTAATQFCAAFSDWGWLLWLSIPAFCIYKAASFIVGWALTPEPDEDSDPALKKKREKMERKLRSGRYQLVQRGGGAGG